MAMLHSATMTSMILLKEHERVGQAFQTQQNQNEDLIQELAKKEKDA